MGSKTLLLLTALAVTTSGCGPEKQTPTPDHLDAPPPIPVQSSGAEGELGSESDDGEVWEGELGGDLVVEVGSKDPGGGLPNTPIEAAVFEVDWSPVNTGSFADIEFVSLTSGVLARSSAGLLQFAEDAGFTPIPDLEFPKGEIMGDWPQDVWLAISEPIESEEGQPDFSHRLSKLNGNKWEAQEFRGEEEWKGVGHELRRSWHKGFLVRSGTRIQRFGSPRDNPKVGPRMGKEVLAIVETRSGRIYSVSQRKTGVYVQRDCKNFDCVEENAVKLPYGQDWSFTQQAPRQRHSVSLSANVGREGVRGFHLLHYEVGGWKLESLVHEPLGLWPTPEGGLWTIVHRALWYRDPKGAWVDVPLPEHAGEITLASDPERSLLWMAGDEGVWTTALEPQLGE